MKIPNYEKDVVPYLIDIRPHGTKSWLTVLPTEMVGGIFGKVLAKKFWKWMWGQTMSVYGVYPCDVRSFLTRGLDKAPVYD